MPVFDKSTWTLGQPVVIARQGRQGQSTSKATISKIGRSWLTVKCATSLVDDRYDFTGRQDSDVGYRAQLWPSQEAFDLEQERRTAWRRLRTFVDSYDPPEHLTLDKIESLTYQLSPES